MRRGIYVVGDPYLFFDTECGINYLNTRIKNQDRYDLSSSFRTIFTHYTGKRIVTDGVEKYQMDSGWFGILPVSMLRIDGLYSPEDVIESRGMRLVKFPLSFAPKIERDKWNFDWLEINFRNARR